MFTLTVPDLDVTTGALPVTWCLDIETVNTIMTDFDKEPTVLIAIAPQRGYARRKEMRFAVPLKDLMTYVHFRHPGPNKIFAVVLNKNIKDVRRKYLGKYEDKYFGDLLNYEGTDFIDDNDPLYMKSYNLTPLRFTVDVDVPDEAFAPEPSKWEKDWVLWLVQDKGADQCAFRKRKIFAYTVQPLLFALNYFVRMFATFLSASLLLRSCSLNFLKSPLQTSTFSLTELFDGRSLLLLKNKRTDWELTDSERSTFKNYFILSKVVFLKYVGLLFLPLLLLVLTPVVMFGGLNLVIGALGVVAIAAAVVFFIGLFLTCFVKCLDLYMAFKKKPKKEKPVKEKKEEELPKLIFTAQDIEYITCNPINTKPSYAKLESLPTPKRTLKLKFQQLKSKVCRPFPG